jgi:hypothetical protein
MITNKQNLLYDGNLLENSFFFNPKKSVSSSSEDIKSVRALSYVHRIAYQWLIWFDLKSTSQTAREGIQ